MNNYTERRKYKRVELEKCKYKEVESPCIARFRVKQYEGQEMSSLEWNIVAVKNLSAGGIKFDYYKKHLGFGSLIDLKIDFIKSISTINCIGRVVRIEMTPHNSMFRIAAEFAEIDDKEREIINTTVEAILSKEVKRRIYSGKLLKIKNILTRGPRSAEVMLEGPTTLKHEDYKKGREEQIITAAFYKKLKMTNNPKEFVWPRLY